MNDNTPLSKEMIVYGIYCLDTGRHLHWGGWIHNNTLITEKEYRSRFKNTNNIILEVEVEVFNIDIIVKALGERYPELLL